MMAIEGFLDTLVLNGIAYCTTFNRANIISLQSLKVTFELALWDTLSALTN